jgi:ABC-type glycerol-3-phosphate transport system substrate-binding protein
MIAGNVPDIIDFTYLDYRAIATAGFLADMNAMFESDSRINRSDFHERVLELLEIDGNLYAMAPSFAVWTYLAPASLVGTSPGITMEQLIQLDERFNNGASLMQNETPQYFLERHGWVNRSSLIDIEAGTAHFDTDSFINILEYANSLGRAGQVLDRPNEDWRPFEQEIRRGNHFISSSFIQNLAELHYIETVAGTEITPIGFPTSDGAGSLMVPTALYGIGQGAQNPSGAWAFIRFLLGEQKQRDMSIETIPVSRVIFDEVIYNLMSPVLIDSPELAGGIWVDGVFIEFAPMTQSKANRITEMINTLGTMFSGGEEVITHIIMEEANGFFNGNRSAEDAARVIQSRVQTYVWERQR